MNKESYVWEAWVGQRIVSCTTDEHNVTTIILEDGRGAGFTTIGLYFTQRAVLPEQVEPK